MKKEAQVNNIEQGFSYSVRCCGCGSRISPKLLHQMYNKKCYCADCIKSWKDHIQNKRRRY